jgi:cellobiose phosphorylase
MNATVAERLTAAGRTRYGHFSEDGTEFIIRRPDTPRPWVNVLCNDDPGYGCIWSQAGGGYSWLVNAELNRITFWQQDLIRDDRGRFIYLQDARTGELWSAGYQPVRRKPEAFECRQGAGYSILSSQNSGVLSRLTVFVPPGAPLEVWLLEVTNLSGAPRDILVTSYLEWCLGTAHDTHREFHRIFIETEFIRERSAILARKRLWAIPNAKGQGWNRDWEGTAFHACSLPIAAFECDREAFVGRYGSLESPAALINGRLAGTSGRWGDPIASLQAPLHLEPGDSADLVFVLGAGRNDADALSLAEHYCNVTRAVEALQETQLWWRARLDGYSAETPDPGLNALLNTWLRYQAMAGRIWGRSGYYQPGGAYGFRDQLQDSLVFLPTEPDRTRRQILLHAAHQFSEGHVFHWWQPITESGAHSRFSDDLLWLPFAVLAYIRETGDTAILKLKAPFVEGPPDTIRNHCERAFDLSLSRRSPRGLPLIGEGDWNDGLSAVGWEGKGESVWVGHFLCYLLPRWAELARNLGDGERAAQYLQAAQDLQSAINTSAWDGEWYFRATCDDGTVIGSSACREGQIFLNAQTWSVISGVCPPERRRQLMRTVRDRLYTAAGPALLRPAYTVPDERIGYLTRYAPGVRENGGVYLHAATWAVWAECLLGRAEQAWRLIQSISPCIRGLDPELYRAEPYVTPGNIDGPDSPHFGRGGWTWYTGSAAWLFRVVAEWLLGVRPAREGLRVAPCIPEDWDGFRVYRRFRGAGYLITVSRNGEGGKLVVDGRPVAGDIVPAFRDGRDHQVELLL